MAKTIQVELQAKTDKAIAEIEDLKKEIQKLNKEVEKGNKQTEDGLKGVENASKDTAKGIRGIGNALKAAGIGLAIAAFTQLKEIFQQNQKVADLFSTAFEVVSLAFNDFVNFVVGNTGAVVNTFKAFFQEIVMLKIDLDFSLGSIAVKVPDQRQDESSVIQHAWPQVNRYLSCLCDQVTNQ